MTIQTGGRQILVRGLALILAGLLWGFAPPMTPFPRLALGAHIQFEVNGLLFLAVGILLLTVPNCVGRKGHELSVRAALGASRTRLMQQAITESLALSILGGVDQLTSICRCSQVGRNCYGHRVSDC